MDWNEKSKIRVCVVGLGYIGLPTAAVLASRGFSVHGVDLNEEVVRTISKGKAHIIEPDLDMLVKASVQSGRFSVSNKPAPADVIILCLPTPIDCENKPDLSSLFEAANTCQLKDRGEVLVIVESTIAPGTTQKIADKLQQKTSVKLRVAHAPERVLPGRILREVIENDRVVGGIDTASTDCAVDFYRSFVMGKVYGTSARLAESVKLIENAYRDVNIAFANELSMAADILNIDIWQAISLANRHPRVNILQPGAGVGGHCIAVDPYFLIDAIGSQHSKLMQAARTVNSSKPKYVYEQVKTAAQKFKSPRVCILGLAYKPDVDDLRESPALKIAHNVKALPDVQLIVVEPNITKIDDLELVDLENGLKNADIIVICVAHEAFKAIEPAVLHQSVVIDACGLFSENQNT